MITTAMILAAGEGRRMRPLTLHTPKPLLAVGDKCLIEWHLQKLKAAGIERVIINIAYLGEQIAQHLGAGTRYGLTLEYSREPEPLETGGALNFALPLLGAEPFLLLNGDVWSDLDYAGLLRQSTAAMHLVLIDNPPHNPAGDFALLEGRVLPCRDEVLPGLTFSGISLVHPRVISGYPQRRYRFPLREILDWLIAEQSLSGEHFRGEWMDVGTPERLAVLRQQLG